MENKNKLKTAIALTGGITCGKSTAMKIFEEEGIPMLDTDDVAHQVMLRGKPAYEKIVNIFGEGLVEINGEINRHRLGNIVFNNADKLDTLNNIIHPEVHRVWRSWLSNILDTKNIAGVVIPLLYELELSKSWDVVICIAASEQTILKRLMKRNFTKKEASQRIAAQWPISRKAASADITIWNDEDLDKFKKKVRVCAYKLSGKE